MAHYGGGGFASRGGLNPRSQGSADHVQIQVDPKGFDFDAEVDGLRAHVKRIKQLSVAIEDERKEQGELISGLEDTMERARLVLRSAMGRMNVAYRQAQSYHLLFVVLFAVFLFTALYILSKVYHAGKTVLGS